MTIPDHMLQWMITSRCQLLAALQKGKPVDYFAAHLPVMATVGGKESSAVNLTVKGIGLLPHPDLLEEYTTAFADIYKAFSKETWNDSLNQRSQVLARLYSDINNFDPSLLGGLEIFEGRTLKNLKKDARVSLLFTGMEHHPERMKYLSFQVNGNAEILVKGDRHYRFLLAARKLFEFDNFHLPQIDYPYGYLIRVTQVLDKSPRIR